MKPASAVVLALVLASCGGGPEPADEARLYAAASLTDVLGALAKEFESVGGGRVVASYGASNTLAQQIREGAAPGVFVSASGEWADRVVEWGVAEPGTRVNFLTNSLVVVVPKGAKERPARLEDLADARWTRIALADPAAVPAGKYAKAALEKAGLWDGVRPRVVSAPDVRAALVYVERGEVPAGIVYATDAAASGKVDVALRVDPALHPRIVYPMLVVKGANRRARELYDFLRSDRARAAFEAAGFGVAK
jgi:molybdate transport system substrate-binding protein